LAPLPTALAQKTINAPVQTFWHQFQSAVAKNDKEAIASLTKFPLGMPYTVPKIKTKAEMLKRFGEVMDAESKKCLAKAKAPNKVGSDGSFSIPCGSAMLYWFGLSGGKYKLTLVDNVNE